ncbi:MAG TPA: hypothetical protein VJU86_19555 [Pyrinomonadaceae bacterium]|nr:hypothetical protein [Pyrinomonadaceae bacterium]
MVKNESNFPVLSERCAANAYRKIFTLALTTVIGIGTISCAGEREKAKLLQLRKIAAETPVYSGLQKVSERTVLKHGKVSLSYSYRSDAKFSELREFYDQTLPKLGWELQKPPGPNIFGEAQNFAIYKQGDHEIGIAQDNARQGHFQIVFEWFE